MPEIKLEHITKRWGKFYAVEDLNLTSPITPSSRCWALPAAAKPPPCA